MTHPFATIRRSPLRRASTSRAALLAACLCLTGHAALAQDAKLGVTASPPLLTAGQSASVDVLAHFPDTTYAFAAAQFNVTSTHPMWSFATSGLIVGNNVTGMNVSQPHAPQSGSPADPRNPYRLWRGTFTPTTTEPALVRIAAAPSGFWVYPSGLTSSSASMPAAGGSAWVLVNPLRVGQWAAAPGPRVRLGADTSGAIRGLTTDPSDPLLIGLLLPAVQKAPETEVDVRFDQLPTSFGLEVPILEDGLSGPMESMSVNFTKMQPSGTNPGPVFGVSMVYTNAATAPVHYDVYLRGCLVATGVADPKRPQIRFDRLPTTLRSRVAPSVIPSRDRSQQGIQVTSRIAFAPTGAPPVLSRITLPNGRSVLADSLELRASRPVAGNNLKQLGLGCHTFTAHSATAMTLRPIQPR